METKPVSQMQIHAKDSVLSETDEKGKHFSQKEKVRKWKDFQGKWQKRQKSNHITGNLQKKTKAIK